VVVEPSTELPERFEPGSELWVTHGTDDPRPIRRLRVVGSRPHRSLLLVRFEGLEDRNAVEELRGMALEAEPVTDARLEEGTFFRYQLEGCRCRDRLHGELGSVVSLVEDGGGLLLIVEGSRGRIPIPFVRELLIEVDIEGGRIEVELPPGLIESCASES